MQDRFLLQVHSLTVFLASPWNQPGFLTNDSEASVCLCFCRKRRRRSQDPDQSRQNTFLCDFTEDKTQYASFIPRSDVTNVKYDITLHQQSSDDVTSHLTTLSSGFPPSGGDFRLCESHGTEGGSPDVVYSPRIPRASAAATGYQSGTPCEACCRTCCSQSGPVSHSQASLYQSQDLLHPTYGGKYLSAAGSGNAGVVTYGKYPQEVEVMNISGNCTLYDTVSNFSSDQVVSVWKPEWLDKITKIFRKQTSDISSLDFGLLDTKRDFELEKRSGRLFQKDLLAFGCLRTNEERSISLTTKCLD